MMGSETNAPYTVRFPGLLVGDRCLPNTVDAERVRWMSFGCCPAMRVYESLWYYQTEAFAMSSSVRFTIGDGGRRVELKVNKSDQTTVRFEFRESRSTWISKRRHGLCVPCYSAVPVPCRTDLSLGTLVGSRAGMIGNSRLIGSGVYLNLP